MDIKIALRVKHLKTGNLKHSWRRIAEVMCDEYPYLPTQMGWNSFEDAYGNQMFGIELCETARETLGENWDED